MTTLTQETSVQIRATIQTEKFHAVRESFMHNENKADPINLVHEFFPRNQFAFINTRGQNHLIIAPYILASIVVYVPRENTLKYL